MQEQSAQSCVSTPTAEHEAELKRLGEGDWELTYTWPKTNGERSWLIAQLEAALEEQRTAAFAALSEDELLAFRDLYNRGLIGRQSRSFMQAAVTMARG